MIIMLQCIIVTMVYPGKLQALNSAQDLLICSKTNDKVT